MVLQVAADVRKVADNRHSGGLERVRRTESGELKQPRRSDRAATHNHLPLGAQSLGSASMSDGHPDCAAVFDFDPKRLRLTDEP